MQTLKVHAANGDWQVNFEDTRVRLPIAKQKNFRAKNRAQLRKLSKPGNHIRLNRTPSVAAVFAQAASTPPASLSEEWSSCNAAIHLALEAFTHPAGVFSFASSYS
jgi:hypothetical protein